MSNAFAGLTLVCVSLIVICLVTGISYAEIDLDTAVGIWLFDDEDNIAVDYSRNGYKGEILGVVNWSDDGNRAV